MDGQKFVSRMVRRASGGLYMPSGGNVIGWLDEDFTSTPYSTLTSGDPITGEAVTSAKWPGKTWSVKTSPQWKWSSSGVYLNNAAGSDVGGILTGLGSGRLQGDFSGHFTGTSDVDGSNDTRGFAVAVSTTEVTRLIFGIQADDGKPIINMKNDGALQTDVGATGVTTSSGYRIDFTWTASTRTATASNGVSEASLTFSEAAVSNLDTFYAIGLLSAGSSNDAQDVIETLYVEGHSL